MLILNMIFLHLYSYLKQIKSETLKTLIITIINFIIKRKNSPRMGEFRN
jgi:hypothetical protein